MLHRFKCAPPKKSVFEELCVFVCVSVCVCLCAHVCVHTQSSHCRHWRSLLFPCGDDLESAPGSLQAAPLRLHLVFLCVWRREHVCACAVYSVRCAYASSTPHTAQLKLAEKSSMENTTAARKNQADSWHSGAKFEGSSQKDEIDFVCAGTQMLEGYQFGRVMQWQIKVLG